MARVITSQNLRSLGIYYNSIRSQWNSYIYKYYYFKLGRRLRLEIDGRARIWAHISKKWKVYVLVLLLAMGFTTKQILGGVCYPNKKILEEEENKEGASPIHQRCYSIIL